MNQEPAFHPVIIGSDLGIYALARSFYEAYGVRSSLLIRSHSPQTRYSTIIDEYFNDLYDAEDSAGTICEKLLQLAPQLQKKHPGKKLLLISNSDSYVSAIAQYRADLSPHYLIGTLPLEVLQKTSNKADFATLCKQFGMDTPPTEIIDFDQPDTVEKVKASCPFAFPAILKPAISEGYELTHWPGKAKVYMPQSQAELNTILDTLDRETAAHQISRQFVLQPRIQGNDTFNLSITAYVDSSGQVTMMSSAHVLLEEHQPGMLGNPAAMVVERYPGLYAQARRFLEGVGWFGFANFDVKVDAGTEQAYFFEVNPRIGRNCYYNTLAGLNPTPFLVQDIIEGERLPYTEVQENAFYHVIPLSIVRRYMDKELWNQIRYLKRKGRAANPMWAKFERRFSLSYLKRWLGLQNFIQRHHLHYRKHYPKQTFLAQAPRCFHTDRLRREV